MKVKAINRITDNQVGNGVEIIFVSGATIKITSAVLRKNCPCASCQNERGDNSHNQPLSPKLGKSSLLKVIPASSAESLDLKKIWLVGNYALGIKWGDNHDSGIYTFEFLKTLA